MELQKHKPYLILFCIFGLMIIVVKMTGSVVTDDRLPVAIMLPDRTGLWTGVTPQFCQNSACGFSVPMENGGTGKTVCPRCGGRLESTSIAERAILPSDTIILKKNYREEKNQWISVSVVVAGRSRASIHRPEWCLSGQGFAVTGYTSDTIQCADGRQIPVTFIDVQSYGQNGMVNHGLFAYWFVSTDGEVASQWQRLVRMAWDNIIYRVSRRWAYVTIMTDMPQGHEDKQTRDKLKTFIAELYPKIRAH